MTETQNTSRRPGALIAMSGGVDSSVAAWLMQRDGFDCTGVTMRLTRNEAVNTEGLHTCCSERDIEDAAEVAYAMDIPYEVLDFTADFQEKIIDKFIRVYEAGGTPNPCIDCNRYIKFEKLMQRADELDFDYVVTGHYSVIEYDEGLQRYLLRKSPDVTKDQSYVLYSLTQRQLSRTLLPLGKLTKHEVRKIAEKYNLINAQKHDSQDICFVPDGDYAKFIEQYTGRKYDFGDFVDENGNVLGTHKGIIRYTIGQRKGLGLALPHPMYVKEKDIANNKVILCDNDRLFSKELYAKDINLIAYEKLDKPLHIKARVRYNQPEQDATVEQLSDNKLHIVFDKPQRAISKGQAVVLYDEDVVVGGGTIE